MVSSSARSGVTARSTRRSARTRKGRLAVVVNFDGTRRLPVRIVAPIMDWQSAFATFSFVSVFPCEPTSGGRRQRNS